MSIEYLIHPLSVTIHDDPLFFTRAQPRLHCLHCFGSCDEAPPVPLPTEHQDVRTGSQLTREANFHQHEILHVHKLYCSLACSKAQACNRDINAFNMMLSKVYGQSEPLLQRKALPPWVLRSHGGPLSLEQFREWIRCGRVNGHSPSSLSSTTGPRALRELMLALAPLSPYRSFQYDHASVVWHTAQPDDTPLVCWNDGHSLAGIKPIPCVLDWDESRAIPIECSGLFCSPQCALSHIIRLGGQHKKIRAFANSVFYSKFFAQRRRAQIDKAPARRLLRKFGGLVEIDAYRSGGCQHRHVRSPPIRDFPCFAALNRQHLYLINVELHSWSVVSNLFRNGNRKDLEMNGDEYGLETREFSRTYHVGPVVGSTCRMQFALMSIEQDVAMQSNPHLLGTIVNRTALSSSSSSSSSLSKSPPHSQEEDQDETETVA
jgi:hypothetical protein